MENYELPRVRLENIQNSDNSNEVDESPTVLRSVQPDQPYDPARITLADIQDASISSLEYCYSSDEDDNDPDKTREFIRPTTYESPRIRLQDIQNVNDNGYEESDDESVDSVDVSFEEDDDQMQIQDHEVEDSQDDDSGDNNQTQFVRRIIRPQAILLYTDSITNERDEPEYSFSKDEEIIQLRGRRRINYGIRPRAGDKTTTRRSCRNPFSEDEMDEETDGKSSAKTAVGVVINRSLRKSLDASVW